MLKNKIKKKTENPTPSIMHTACNQIIPTLARCVPLRIGLLVSQGKSIYCISISTSCKPTAWEWRIGLQTNQIQIRYDIYNHILSNSQSHIRYGYGLVSKTHIYIC